MISEHVSLHEATRSQTATRLGIANEPGPDMLVPMQAVAEYCFEPARRHFGRAIYVSSFYRSPELNKAIGGSPTSDHCLGRAMDLDADTYGGLTNAQLFDWLRANVPFDQLIWEFGDDANPAWVHVSYRGPSNRGLVLRARLVGGKTTYEVMP